MTYPAYREAMDDPGRHRRLVASVPKPEELSESDALARIADAKDRESEVAFLAWQKRHPPAKPKQKHLRVPEELRLEVLRLHDKGDGLTRIARAMGLHRSTVQRIVEKGREG